MTTKIITRKQYMNKECSHSTYYAQFVTESTRREVLNRFGLDKLVQAAAENSSFNTRSTPLDDWDMVNSHHHRENFKAAESFFALSDKVCILKEAARQLVWESGNIIYPEGSSTLNFCSADDPDCPADIFEGEGRHKVIGLCNRLEELLREHVTNIDSREAQTLRDLKSVTWRKDGDIVSAEIDSDRVNPDWLQFQIVVIGDRYQAAGGIVG